jgi:hypothetical protein
MFSALYGTELCWVHWGRIMLGSFFSKKKKYIEIIKIIENKRKEIKKKKKNEKYTLPPNVSHIFQFCLQNEKNSNAPNQVS